MDVYLIPITWAAIIFPILAACITLPYALYEYHKYGSLPWLRTLIVFSFIFYLLSVYCLIILPLPDRSDPSLFSLAGHLELCPFNDLYEYVIKYGFSLRPRAILAFFRSHTFLQLAFNVLMTLPFGVYLRYYFKRSLPQSALFGFLLSLFFELTQLSALYGFYPAPYRCFDTDDLICNTLGTVIGYLVAPGLLFFLPQREKIDATAIHGSRKVTLFRRICGTLVDFFLVTLILVAAQVYIILIYPEFSTSFSLPVETTCFFGFQWICAVLSDGYTPGKRLCHLRIMDLNDQPATRLHITLRYFLIWFQLCGTQLLGQFCTFLSRHTSGFLLAPLYIITIAAEILWIAFFFEFLFRFFSRRSGRPFWYERKSGTHSVSVFPVKTAASSK